MEKRYADQDVASLEEEVKQNNNNIEKKEESQK